MNQNDVNDVLLLTDSECAQQVGQRLCVARQSLGLTTQVLAELLETSDAKITEVEQGKLFLPTPWGNKLYRFLGINLTWLLTGDGEIARPPIPDVKDLFYYIQVPEVEERMFTELSKFKTFLKDQIREYERIHVLSLNRGLQ
ncbi:MAG: helix-turn-helix transcriptional regulator [Candidatus Aminicenantes bacterium]|nr:helix-turn-helix transcriptional regulator [Candidatus Aminicenantes bacterium]